MKSIGSRNMEIVNSGTWDRIKGLVGMVSVGIKSTGGKKYNDWRDPISTLRFFRRLGHKYMQ